MEHPERIVAVRAYDCGPEGYLQELSRRKRGIWVTVRVGYRVATISREGGRGIDGAIPEGIAGRVIDGFGLVGGVEPLDLVSEVERGEQIRRDRDGTDVGCVV